MKADGQTTTTTTTKTQLRRNYQGRLSTLSNAKKGRRRNDKYVKRYGDGKRERETTKTTTTTTRTMTQCLQGWRRNETRQGQENEEDDDDGKETNKLPKAFLR
jgi:hypothetical protein